LDRQRGVSTLLTILKKKLKFIRGEGPPVVPFHKDDQSGSFSRHASAGGHPDFSAKYFWIPACAGMTSFE
jgi:hypothetical protein